MIMNPSSVITVFNVLSYLINNDHNIVLQSRFYLQAAACLFLAHFELFMQERENFHRFELQYISGNDV